MKIRSTLLAVLLAASWSTTASALPPPKTEAEMLQMSDLVVDAEGKTIICDGKPVVTTQKTTTTYLSTLWPSKIYKGGTPKSLQIRGKVVTWTPGPGPVGGWFQEPVPKGWVGKLFLKKESDGTYTKVWWNADIEDTKLSKPQPLPSCAAATDGGLPAQDSATPQNDATPTPQDGSVTPADASVTPADASASAESNHPLDTGIIHEAGDPIDAPGPSQDSGTTTTPSSDGGCSVGATTSSDAPGFGLLLLLGLAALLQRRRA